ncbi:hypothetical protein ACUSIJ_15200 [Pseudochelatococcus sp. B33]
MSAWIVIGNPVFILAGGQLVDRDAANAAAAFEIFARDGWRWPLGANPHFGGNNVFFNDAAPWYALLAKAVHTATGFAPSYHWLVLINFVLFSVMAHRLMRALTDDRACQWLGTLLLTFSLTMPVPMIADQHVALSSLWVVLWAMTAVPLPREEASFARRWEYVPALLFAMGSHAYLAAMAATFILLALLHARRWGAALIALLWPLLLLWAVGALDHPHVPMGGAKLYALDLAAFLNSLGWGLLGAPYAIQEVQQSSALLYLGTGVWFLAVVLVLAGALALARRRRSVPQSAISSGRVLRAPARLGLVVVGSLFLALFAMAFNLRVAGPVWVELPIPAFLGRLYESFRAVGRFGTPLAYSLILLVVLGFTALTRGRRIFWAAGAIAVLLQAADLRHAGRLSPTEAQFADAADQARTVADLLAGGWSGTVYKQVGYYDLEQQRLLDYLLIRNGATHFEIAYNARLVGHEVERRSGFAAARAGDLVIVQQESLPADRPACSREAAFKTFILCLKE